MVCNPVTHFATSDCHAATASNLSHQHTHTLSQLFPTTQTKHETFKHIKIWRSKNMLYGYKNFKLKIKFSRKSLGQNISSSIDWWEYMFFVVWMFIFMSVIFERFHTYFVEKKRFSNISCPDKRPTPLRLGTWSIDRQLF